MQSGARWVHRWCGAGLMSALAACSATSAERAPSIVPTLGPALTYSYSDFNGDEVSSTTMRGRMTLVVLLTTYDVASQLVLRRVNQTLNSFVPRINAFGVVLEPASYAVLVPPFHQSMALRFPLVMADLGSLDGAGPFGPIDYVPTVVVLDANGGVRRRFKGPVTVDDLTKALREIQGEAGDQPAP